MKLVRLKIDEPFRSLQAGFELHFLREWDRTEDTNATDREFAPYILAGPNGSGKSNVLEVLAAIFYHLECQYLKYQPNIFAFDEEINPYGFKAECAQPNAFELEYLIPTPDMLQEGAAGLAAHIKIVKTPESGAQMFWLNHPGFVEGNPLSRTDAWELLPNFVLGYSSGENEILSLPFFKMRFIQLDEYLDKLKKDLPYEGRPESRQIYLDNSFNQAILLSNLLFQNVETLKLFQQEVGIEGLKQFRIILKKRIKLSADEANNYPEDLLVFEENYWGEKSYYLPLLKKFESKPDTERKFDAVINRLQRCATCHYLDSETDTLYLDYLVNANTIAAFKNNFSSAIDLFQSLQILLILNLYSVSDQLKAELYGSGSLYVNETVPTLPSDERIMRFKDLVVKKEGVSETIYLKSLSDGEHQFLHSLGLCMLYKDTNSLFLLDEPETHFNPGWRSKFISRLRDCFRQTDQNKNVQREMLITTHTPFLISDSKPEQVLVFTKANGEVAVNRPEYKTLGASVDQITMLTFNKTVTIGGYAESKLLDIQERFEKGEDKDVLLQEIKQLGDSVEKMLLIRNLNNRGN
ncbi:restriction system-associated AAA family ATPase [Methylobacter sp.]